MLGREATKTTVGIALRPLRSIFNEAIEDRIIVRENCYRLEEKNIRYQLSGTSKKHLLGMN